MNESSNVQEGSHHPDREDETMKFSTLEMSMASQIESDRILALKMANEAGYQPPVIKSDTLMPSHLDP